MRRPVNTPTRPRRRAFVRMGRRALIGVGLLAAFAVQARFPAQPRQGSDCDGPALQLQAQARQAFEQAQQFARQRDLQRPPPQCFSNPSCAMQWNQQQQRYGQVIAQQQQRAQALQNEAQQGLFQCRQQLAQFERQRQFEQAQQQQLQQQRLIEQQQADFERRQRRVTEAVTAITRIASGEMTVGDGMAQLAERQARKKLGHEGTEVVKAIGSGLVTQLRDGGARVGGETPFVPEPPIAPAPPQVAAVMPAPAPPAPAPFVPADAQSAPAPRALPLLVAGLREVDGFGPLPEPAPAAPAPAPTPSPSPTPVPVLAPAPAPAVVPPESPSPRRGPAGGPPPVARTPAITRLVACLGRPVAERQQCLPEVCLEEELRFEPRCAVFR